MDEIPARDMYQEHILDHYKHPKNHGTLTQKTHVHRETNPYCGDEIEIHVNAPHETIETIAFSGTACALSTAAASILTQHIKGKKIAHVKNIQEKDLLKLMGIPINPLRQQCVILPLSTLKKAILHGTITHT